MKLLLDTHVFLWWLADSPRLSPMCRDLIATTTTTVYISAASIWEMAIKSALGKLRVREASGVAALDQLIAKSGFLELPITAAHGAATSRLPLHHGDPFDRLLVAQTLVEQLTLATADALLKDYQIPMLQAGA
jgi:PIN domain nuclease of toxin-antitoxin system